MPLSTRAESMAQLLSKLVDVKYIIPLSFLEQASKQAAEGQPPPAPIAAMWLHQAHLQTLNFPPSIPQQLQPQLPAATATHPQAL
jgi:hypothetical protein